jgi:hypothetical protein
VVLESTATRESGERRLKLEIIEITPENCEAIVAPLVARHLDVTQQLAAEMTQEQAELVRHWRVCLGCTWGRIGDLWEQSHPEWGGGQLVGRALCWQAATLLGESPHNEPWN